MLVECLLGLIAMVNILHEQKEYIAAKTHGVLYFGSFSEVFSVNNNSSICYALITHSMQLASVLHTVSQ